MIDCNLAVLLAERNLKITQVSKDTGISRTTLTSLSSDFSGGIKFDTLNTLCNYLRVTPDRFFSYIPYDYSVNCSYIDGNMYSVDFTILKHSTKWELCTAVDLDIDSSEPCAFFSGTLEQAFSCDEEGLKEDESALQEFKKMCNAMTPRQIINLKNNIINELISCVESVLTDAGVEISQDLSVEIYIDDIV